MYEEWLPSADIELEEENPELTLMLSRLAKKALDWLDRNVVKPIVQSRDRLRSLFSIRRAERGDDYVAVLAVDSTWSKPPLELVSGLMAIIVTGYIVAVPQHPGFYGIKYASLRRSVGEYEERFSLSVELKAKVLEFVTARRELINHSFVDLVLIDGPLFPGATLPQFYDPRGLADPLRHSREAYGRELAHYVSAALINLLDDAHDLEKPVVGVVKRVSSRFLYRKLVDAGLLGAAEALRRSNDKTLMSFVLRPGEYTVVGDFYTLLIESLRLRGQRRLVSILEESCRGVLGELPQRLCRYMRDTAVVYYMPSQDLVYPQAIRLDIYPSSRVEEVVSYAISDTSHNAVPTPIDLVDRFVRIEASAIRRFHTLLQAYAQQDNVKLVVGLTNPQKLYLYKHGERFISME